MVRPSGRRGDDDLGPVTDRKGRGRTVTASSRGVHPGLLLNHPVPFRSRLPHPSLLSHTPVPYEVYGYTYPHSQPPPTVYDPYLAAPVVRLYIPYRSLAQEPLTEFSGPARQLGGHERVDDGNGEDDDHDDGVDAGDEEQSVSLVPVAYASGFDGRPRHGKGKGLTGNFMSVMSKITGSCYASSYTEEESEGFRLGADRSSRERSC
ncbi:hypothetical protein M9H77_30013 [Catharanthus roseus]|uniref:Uncharacterized protein n=1 Tax=Catharanthus roseus TaxID=4058 RepID=A0ACB9ZWF8_CATRO|nr:hypothetical protein M9H77_30013 [Catharanthus roseus]